MKIANWVIPLIFSTILLTGCPTQPKTDLEKEEFQAPYVGKWEFEKSVFTGSAQFELKDYFISLNRDGTFRSNFSFYLTLDPSDGLDNINGTWEVKKKYTYWEDWYPLLIITYSGNNKTWRISRNGEKLNWFENSEDIKSLITWRSK
jgi:hypothetical protein